MGTPLQDYMIHGSTEFDTPRVASLALPLGLPCPCSPLPTQITAVAMVAYNAVRGIMADSLRVKPQDEAFEEALRQDQASLAAKKVRTPAVSETDTQQQEEQTPPSIVPDSTEDAGGRSLRDTRIEPEDGPIISPSAEETPEQRRAKIAQSFAHLELGS